MKKKVGVMPIVCGRGLLAYARQITQGDKNFDSPEHYVATRIQGEAQALGQDNIQALDDLAHAKPMLFPPKHVKAEVFPTFKDDDRFMSDVRAPVAQQNAVKGHRDDINPEILALAERGLDAHHEREQAELAIQRTVEEYALTEMQASEHTNEVIFNASIKELHDNYVKNTAILEQLHVHEKAQFKAHDRPLEETLHITNDHLNFKSFEAYVDARIQEAQHILEIDDKTQTLEQDREVNHGDLSQSEDFIRAHLQTQATQQEIDQASEIPGLLENRSRDKFERSMWASSWTDITTPLQDQKSAYEASLEHTINCETHDFDTVETEKITDQELINWQNDSHEMDGSDLER